MMCPMNVDKSWFQKVIRASPYRSLREISKRILSEKGKQIPHTALLFSIQGRRQFKLYEVRQFADLVRQPLLEVIRKCGVDVFPTDMPSDLLEK